METSHSINFTFLMRSHLLILLMLSVSGLHSVSAATLVGHWTFDTGGANSVAGGGAANLNPGSNPAATISTSETAGSLGGGSLDLHDEGAATGQTAVIASTPALAIGTNLSISYWMKANHTSTAYGQPDAYTRPIAMNSGTANAGWEFQRNNESGNLQFRADTSAGENQLVGPSTVVFDGGWHHILVTVVGSSVSYYVDGVRNNYTINAGTNGVVDPVSPLIIGSQQANGSARNFDGWIDDLSMWGTAILTEGEARGVYSLGTVLGYDASEANQLYTLHNNGAGSVTINGQEWVYVTGAFGTVGTLAAGSTYGMGQYDRVLALTSTTGVALVPEPSRAALLLVGCFLLGMHRRRRH